MVYDPSLRRKCLASSERRVTSSPTIGASLYPPSSPGASPASDVPAAEASSSARLTGTLTVSSASEHITASHCLNRFFIFIIFPLSHCISLFLPIYMVFCIISLYYCLIYM